MEEYIARSISQAASVAWTHYTTTERAEPLLARLHYQPDLHNLKATISKNTMKYPLMSQALKMDHLSPTRPRIVSQDTTEQSDETQDTTLGNIWPYRTYGWRIAELYC